MSTATAERVAAKPRARAGAKADDPMIGVRRAANLLKQASDPTRLRVLMLLGDGERNVGTLCADLGNASQPAVSHHLALLRHGRLIEPRRDGKHNFYGLTDEGRRLVEAVGVIAG